MAELFFRGASNVKVDEKGRLGIPTRYRNEIDNSCKGALVLTADVSGCVLLFPRHVWPAVEKKILGLPTLDKGARFLQRLMVGHATECEVDTQGRVLLPPPLRKHAGLKKNCLLIGQGQKFELWDQSKWDEECNSQLLEGKEMSEFLEDVHF